jgi:hypothetical protein
MLAYLRMMKQETATLGRCLDEAKHIYLQALSRHQGRDLEGATKFAIASSSISLTVENVMSRTFHSSANYPKLVPPPPPHSFANGYVAQPHEAIALSIAPKFSTDVSGSLEPANPMATVFVLSNHGPLPIHNVIAKWGEIQLNAPPFAKIQSAPDSGILLRGSKAEVLSPGHKMTLPCAHAIGLMGGVGNPESVTSAEMTIIVDYRPDWIPWHMTTKFPWMAEKTQNGNWIWKSISR